MIKKILVSLSFFSLGAQLIASTPVNQGSAFPDGPPSQKEAWENSKKRKGPRFDYEPIAKPTAPSLDKK